jgi:hypothetical protein
MVVFILRIRDLSRFRFSSTSCITSLEGKIADAWVTEDYVVALVNHTSPIQMP